MTAEVALAQALSYARDLRALYEAAREREREIGRAHERLRGAYQQALVCVADLKKTYGRLERAILGSLQGLANALEAKDVYTRGHSERVATLARRVALAGGLGPLEAETIAQAGLLHDLGKIGVPERVLRKPAPLTHEEWEVMRQHPVVGARIVAPLEFFADGALILRHHHERQDGSGYPDGLVGESVPLGARVVAIADTYDALTSDRPYRPALSHPEALARLEAAAGRTLDARLTAVCLALIRDAPPRRSL